MKISWGEAPTYFFMGEIKVEHPTYFFAAKIKVVKTFMASNLLFILENKSWGYKSQFQRNAYSLWSRQSQAMVELFTARASLLSEYISISFSIFLSLYIYVHVYVVT